MLRGFERRWNFVARRHSCSAMHSLRDHRGAPLVASRPAPPTTSTADVAGSLALRRHDARRVARWPCSLTVASLPRNENRQLCLLGKERIKNGALFSPSLFLSFFVCFCFEEGVDRKEGGRRSAYSLGAAISLRSIFPAVRPDTLPRMPKQFHQISARPFARLPHRRPSGSPSARRLTH